jgi:glycosyltransferase involved in cell wall biosynthesis
MDEPWADVDRAGEWLLGVAARVRPELVHVNSYAHAALPWNAPVLCVAHSCVHSWWRAVKREAAPAKYDEYRRRITAGLNAADLTAAPSHAMLRALAEEYGFSGESCVIPNARTPEQFRPAPVKEPLVLTCGRLWDEAKNVTAVDAVAATLSWPVYVAGDDRHPGGGSSQFAAARPLGTLGAAEIAHWLSRASVYALPARYEPFGLSALEAALSGCALVLGDIPSLREIWGDAALYVHAEDHAALRDTLERVIRSDALRSDLAERARQRARRYTPDRMVSGYVEAYARAERNHAARARVAA